MSLSNPKVKAGTTTAVNAAARESNFLLPPTVGVPHDDRRRSQATSPHRTITDRELTLVQICCDFVCACIALPLSLIILAQLSSARVNAPGHLVWNIEIDSLFPVAVVIALALGGVYR